MIHDICTAEIRVLLYERFCCHPTDDHLPTGPAGRLQLWLR